MTPGSEARPALSISTADQLLASILADRIRSAGTATGVWYGQTASFFLLFFRFSISFYLYILSVR